MNALKQFTANAPRKVYNALYSSLEFRLSFLYFPFPFPFPLHFVFHSKDSLGKTLEMEVPDISLFLCIHTSFLEAHSPAHTLLRNIYSKPLWLLVLSISTPASALDAPQSRLIQII